MSNHLSAHEQATLNEIYFSGRDKLPPGPGWFQPVARRKARIFAMTVAMGVFLAVLVWVGRRWVPLWTAGSVVDQAGMAGAMLMPVYVLLALTVHELGHVAAALLCGLRVREFVLGEFGATLFRVRWWGCRIVIRTTLFDGHMRADPRSGRTSRIQETVLLLGGPAANAVMIAAAAAVLIAGVEPSFTTPLMVTVILTNGLMLGRSLMPLPMETADGVVDNDGLSLIRLWRP